MKISPMWGFIFQKVWWGGRGREIFLSYDNSGHLLGLQLAFSLVKIKKV